MSVCHVFGAGEFSPKKPEINEGDLIIACDGGLNNLLKLNLSPDLIIGDFDSLSYTPDGENVIKLPVEKDYTDVGAAIEYGLKQNFREFRLYCCTGGRPSHTLANIQLIAGLAEKGNRAFLYGEENVTALHCGSLVFENGEGTVSVFASSPSLGVNLSGFKYPLDNAVLSPDFPLGVSNEIVDNKAIVTVKNGTLIVFYPNKLSEPTFRK